MQIKPETSQEEINEWTGLNQFPELEVGASRMHWGFLASKKKKGSK